MSFGQNQQGHGFPANRFAAGRSGTPREPQDSAGQMSGSSAISPTRTHPYHPNCPDSLNCLPDTDEKPNHILPIIVRSAILGSPKKKLTLREIYAAIEEKWPYYRTTQTGWKDSIRHNLSLNRLFVKVPRPGTESGYGSYWTVDLDAPPGSKRPRKRGVFSQAGSSSEMLQRDLSGFRDIGAMIIPPFRLTKDEPNPLTTHASLSSSEPEPENEQIEEPPSDYESEEAEALSPAPEIEQGFGPPSITSHPNPNESSDEKISRLQAQLFESQRQVSAASAYSLRLSEQLEEAKDEACQAQEKLQAAREQLEEEMVARVKVEKRLEEEEILRKDTEEQLKALFRKGGPETKLFEAMRSIQEIAKKALER